MSLECCGSSRWILNEEKGENIGTFSFLTGLWVRSSKSQTWTKVGLLSPKLKSKPVQWVFLSPWLSCLSRCGVLKKLHTPCAQMTKISKGLSRAWMCLAALRPVFWLLSCLPGSPALRSAVLGARSPRSHSAPGLKRNIGSSSLRPGRLTSPPVRGNYLVHEWTCVFIGVSPWRWVFVAPKLSLYVRNPSLSQQYGMCRALEWQCRWASCRAVPLQTGFWWKGWSPTDCHMPNLSFDPSCALTEHRWNTTDFFMSWIKM